MEQKLGRGTEPRMPWLHTATSASGPALPRQHPEMRPHRQLAKHCMAGVGGRLHPDRQLCLQTVR